MKFDNTPLTPSERFCLSRWYWPTLGVIIAIGLGSLLRILGGHP